MPLTLITRSALNLVQTFALFYVLDIPRSVLVIEGVFPCIFHHYKFFLLLILYCTVPMWVHKKSKKYFFLISIFFHQNLSSGQELGELIRMVVSEFFSDA